MVDFKQALRDYRASQSQEESMAKQADVTTAPSNTELVRSSYNALTIPSQQLTTFLRDNVGAQGLKPFDLDKIKVPAGGGIAWEVPTLKGPESATVIEGIVIHFKDVRSYWKDKFGSTGGSNPPDCSSDDSLVGIGKPGGDCQKCPLAQFGSAIDDKGQPSAGQACRQIRLLLFLRQDSMIPLLVVIPPTSSKNVRQYFLRLVSNGYPYYGVTTQLRLEKSKSGGGVVYSQATFAMGRKLEQEEFERVQVIGLAMKELFSRATVVAADVHG